MILQIGASTMQSLTLANQTVLLARIEDVLNDVSISSSTLQNANVCPALSL
jgi:hypothetical protein